MAVGASSCPHPPHSLPLMQQRAPRQWQSTSATWSAGGRAPPSHSAGTGGQQQQHTHIFCLRHASRSAAFNLGLLVFGCTAVGGQGYSSQRPPPASPSDCCWPCRSLPRCSRLRRLYERGVLGDVVEEWEEWQNDLLLQGLQAQNKTAARGTRKHRRDDGPEVDLDAPRQVCRGVGDAPAVPGPPITLVSPAIGARPSLAVGLTGCMRVLACSSCQGALTLY